MSILEVIVYDLLGSAAILVGLMAFIGLVLQKSPLDEVITGTIKTIVGFLVFGIGSGAAAAALNSFQEMFASGFGLEGVLPLAEAVTALAQEKFGTVVSLVMVLGFAMNLLVARITPFKNIFLKLVSLSNLCFKYLVTAVTVKYFSFIKSPLISHYNM